jgi:PAS domain S-box-containing protein
MAVNHTRALKTPAALDPRNLFAGGGEMGALMQGADWATTRLGPIETWSPALRMMVRFLLANRFPLLLWWGPDFCQFYNDAYRPILGTKHPQFLGQPVRECWSEIWHILEPLIRTPFEGGPATWMEDIPLELNRHGFVEETHFTIAYSPVPDDTAPRGIGGVLATVHEISEKVVGERRTMALRDLGAGVLEERNAQEACSRAVEILANYPKDIPFSLIYLLDADQKAAHLVCRSEMKSNASTGPALISIDPHESPAWPFGKVIATGQIELVEDLSSRLAAVPTGPWSDPPSRAAIVPIHSNTAHQLAGFLVAALSPRLRYDDSYRGFLELVSSQIATAVANARAYEEEKKRAEALAEIDRAKTTFFTNISHEFRTPLTLLLTPIEETLGKPDATLGQEERSHLEVAHRNGMRLLKLVNTLLDFARIEAGRIQATYEPADLCVLTADLASMFRSVIERAGLYLEVACAPLGEPIYVDRDMWEKIVLNLISNAFKFTFNGGIRVQLNDSGQCVEFAVVDTGTGIPGSELPRLFERFHRVHGAAGRTFEGSGIGLALVHELVKLHGGRVSVESVVGRGSTFRVLIPKGKAHLPPDRIQSASNNSSAGRAISSYVAEASKWIPGSSEQVVDFPVMEETLGNPKPAFEESPNASGHVATILLADDNTDMRDYLEKLLDKHYRVVAVSNGVEALKAIETGSPDLILTDVMMPLMDGFGLLRAVRDNPSTRSIPVIILSARAGEEARIEGGEAGADDYLVKPFSARELLTRVGAQLRLSRIRQEADAWVRDNEKRFRAFVNASCDVVYRMSPDWTEMWQLDGQGFISDTAGPKKNWIHEYIDPEDQPMVWRAIEKAILTKSTFELEHRVRQVDGILGWTLSRAIPILDEKGDIVEWLGAAKNITDRKQVEQALRTSETELRELNSRLKAELAATMRMQQLSERLVQLDDWNQLLSEILDAAIDIAHADMGNIQLFHGDALKIVVHRGFHAPFLDFFNSVNQGHAACGTALRDAQRVIVEDVTKSPIFIGSQALKVMLDAGVRAVQSTPFIDQSGQVLGIFSTHYRTARRPLDSELRTLDVLARLAAELIKRKQTEDALRHSEQRMRLITDASPIMVWMSGTDKLCNYFNKAWLDFVGRTLEQERGNGWTENVHPDDFDRCFQVHVSSFDARRPFQVEYRLRHHSGEYRWILDSAVPRYASDGTFEGYVGGCLDIHVQKEASQTRSRLAAIVESSDDAIIGNDLNGIVTSWNRQAERLFGYTKKEMVGRSILTVIPPELHLDEEMILSKIRSGHKIDHFETVRIAKSGERIEVSLSVSPVRDAHENVVGAAKIVRDIRETRKIERALRTTEKLAAAGRLAATVAHEINNPLEAVNNLVFLAKREAGDASRVSEHLRLAERELDRVSHIVRQTLGFYRDTSAPTRCDVSKIFDDLLVLYEKRFEARNIRVIKQYESNPDISAFAGEIRQAFSNLLSNAMDAMPSGGCLVIRVSKTHEWSNSFQPGVRVTILDTGTGIPSHVREDLFEPFFTTKAEVGTGLGLWITKNIVEKHRGNIRFVSRTGSRGHGTAFSIFLPFNAQDDAARKFEAQKSKLMLT